MIKWYKAKVLQTQEMWAVFFRNYKKTAKITGIEDLIRRFYIILTALFSHDHEVNSDQFNKFTHETAKLYVKMYNWYRMPVSVHKILIHSCSSYICAFTNWNNVRRSSRNEQNYITSKRTTYSQKFQGEYNCRFNTYYVANVWSRNIDHSFSKIYKQKSYSWMCFRFL